jgi:hypothetical protein
MKGAAPGQRIGDRSATCAQHLGANPFDAPGHLGCRTPRKSHQQDAARIGATDDEMGDLVGKRVCLARTGTGNDEQRTGQGLTPDVSAAVLDSTPLRIIQLFKIGRRHATPNPQSPEQNMNVRDSLRLGKPAAIAV